MVRRAHLADRFNCIVAVVAEAVGNPWRHRLRLPRSEEHRAVANRQGKPPTEYGEGLGVGAVIDEVLASIGIPEMARQAGEIGDAEQTLRYAAHVTRLVSERLVDLEGLISVANRHEIAHVSDRMRERNISGVLATVLDSPRRRQDLSNDETRDVFLALASLTVYRMLVKERGWAPERYEHWLGDLLITSLLR
jgi:hypothetical protein